MNHNKKMDAKALVATLSKYVNVMSHSKEEVAKEILREHRTIQQSMFGLMLYVIEQWSKQEHYDLRNEYTIQSSKKIMEVMIDSHMPFI
mgnify:CR=1 FL=1